MNIFHIIRKLVMKYDDYLLKVLKDECPFCDINEDYILDRSKYFSVLVARAPYVKDHLLVVPNRHFVRLSEMTFSESKSLIHILEKWTGYLEQIYKEINILLRDGEANGIIGKSIDHLHFHLIPSQQIHVSSLGGSRKIYSDYRLMREVQNLKKRLNLD